MTQRLRKVVEIQAAGSINGQMPIGLELGHPEAASLYLRATPVVQAQAQLTLDAHGVKSVEATVPIDATLAFGAQILGGMADWNVQLARGNIGRLVGLRYERGQGWRYAEFQPGQSMIHALQWLEAAQRRGQELATGALGRARAAERRVVSTFADAWTLIHGSGAADLVKEPKPEDQAH